METISKDVEFDKKITSIFNAQKSYLHVVEQSTVEEPIAKLKNSVWWL